MIYIKNNTEIQTIFIPRNELQKEAYIASTKTYEDGYRDGLEDGKEQQKDKLLNLYVTENGQYEREDGWGVVTVDTPDCSGVYDEGYNQGYEDGYNQGQAECPDCPEGGSCNLGEGEFVFGTSDIGTYELNASDDGYDGWSKIYLEIEGEGGAIKVHRAADLLDSFNNYNGEGLDYGWNYYVGGKITEIREVNTQYGNATYYLDNGFQVFRGKWIDGSSFSSEDQIKVGAYIVVYGVLAEYKGTLQLSKNSQVIAYQECTGGEIISCNLEDKSVTPSMSDRDGNNLIVVEESEGYDGLSRVVIDPQTIYNEGVEAGKTEKETDIAANARVLDVTENGVYRTKFSDPIIPANYTVTGVYADSTNFYSYAELKGKVFNTNIPATMNSRIEFWYKGDNTLSGDAYNVIMGAHYMGDSIVFEVIYNIFSNSEVSGRIGSTYFNTNWDENVWHHIILSKNDGFIVDGVKIGDMQSASYTSNGNFLINANDYNNLRNANGCFGMIKIDDVIIIPTADGFLNTNTGELLEVVKDGTYTYTENLPIYGEGELYKTINVNVPDLNGSYDEGFNVGYEQGQADMAAKARVLEVTENGVYRSKFSDPIVPTNYTVTGVYADGTEFYNYAYLKNIQYNTNIYPMSNTVMEIWWKYDGSKEGREGCIIGCQNWGYANSIFKIGWNFGDNKLLASINDDTIFITFIEGWNHIVMSYANGLWLNGTKIGVFPSNITDDMDNKEPICINGYYGNNRMNSDYFGMIKIDDVVIIPTANGFLNTNTGELLEVLKDGDYTFTENLPIYGEGELYKTINVNVPSVQEQITDYYYCPITITDSGFGERAKSFMVKNESMYGENGWINDDSFVYLPTANNMNEVRTKTSPSLVASFPFDDNAAYYTGALYMNVEEVQMNNVVLSNLYKLELGSGCHILRMESSNLPNINTLIIRYNGQELFDYHFGLTQFKNGGKLYVYEGLGNAENLRAALGSEWTIEYL